jgi:putative redox protein
MVAIREKIVVEQRLQGVGETHARTRVAAGEVATIIDEPPERGGTGLGLSPTQTLMAALVACTNVISNKIARRMGVRLEEMRIDIASTFDRRGVTLAEEVERPFKDMRLTIRVRTDATAEQIETLKADLAKFCPVSKVIRAAGVQVSEDWQIERL